jgi:signal transduction histidine kinase
MKKADFERLSGARRVEYSLGLGRALLATVALITTFADPTEPARYATLAYLLMVTYLGLALAALAVVNKSSELSPAFGVRHQLVDIAFAAVITSVTQGPGTPFFAFFIYVLVAAAYRWGFRATLATALGVFVIIVLQSLIVFGGKLTGTFELNQVIMRAFYLLMIAVVLGHLAEEQKRVGREAVTAATILGKVHAEQGFRGSLRAVLIHLVGQYDWRQALIVVQEVSTGRLYAWQAGRTPEGVSLDLRELAEGDSAAHLFPLQSEVSALAIGTDRRGSRFAIALDRGGGRVAADRSAARAFLGAHPCRAVLCCALELGDEWRGRFILLDPAEGLVDERNLRGLQGLVRQLAPALYSVYLLRRLRSRASAIERARIARELHDGVIQSLIGLEMEVDVLRRQGDGSQRPGDLERIQRVLREEAVNVRMLVDQIRPPESPPGRIVDLLGAVVERFRRQTGVDTRFVTDLEDVRLPARVCGELGRIVQEALVNVQRHSGARSVLVRFGLANGAWQLLIDDNGRGFDFTGRLVHADLDLRRLGPVVIKERVRALGGELTITSTPGRGAQLEVAIPQHTHV